MGSLSGFSFSNIPFVKNYPFILGFEKVQNLILGHRNKGGRLNSLARVRTLFKLGVKQGIPSRHFLPASACTKSSQPSERRETLVAITANPFDKIENN